MNSGSKLIPVPLEHKDKGWKIHWLKVTPLAHEGIARFKVQSEHGSSLYLVDLQSDQGTGRCGCPNFSIGRAKDPLHSCKHCKAVRIYLGEELVESWLQTRHEHDKTQ